MGSRSSGGWPPAAAEREGPDVSELSRSDDEDGVGRDWSEPKANGTPRRSPFHQRLRARSTPSWRRDECDAHFFILSPENGLFRWDCGYDMNHTASHPYCGAEMGNELVRGPEAAVYQSSPLVFSPLRISVELMLVRGASRSLAWSSLQSSLVFSVPRRG